MNSDNKVEEEVMDFDHENAETETDVLKNENKCLPKRVNIVCKIYGQVYWWGGDSMHSLHTHPPILSWYHCIMNN